MIEQLRLPFASVMPASNMSDKATPDGDFLSMMDAQTQQDPQDDPTGDTSILIQMFGQPVQIPLPEPKTRSLSEPTAQLESDSSAALTTLTWVQADSNSAKPRDVVLLQPDLGPSSQPGDPNGAETKAAPLFVEARKPPPKPAQITTNMRSEAAPASADIDSGEILPAQQTAITSEEINVPESTLVQPEAGQMQTASTASNARVFAAPEGSTNGARETVFSRTESPKLVHATGLVQPAETQYTAPENRDHGHQTESFVVLRQEVIAKVTGSDRFAAQKKTGRASDAIADSKSIPAPDNDQNSVAPAHPPVEPTANADEHLTQQIAIAADKDLNALASTHRPSDPAPNPTRSALVAPANLHSQLLHQAPAAIERQVEVLLSPEELGRVKFQIRHHGDTVTVMLSAERPETMDMLRRHGSDLMREFREAGFSGASLDFGRWGQQSHPQQHSAASFALSEDFVPADPIVRPTPTAPPQQSDTHGLNIRL